MASGDPNKHSNTEHDSDDEQSAVSGYKAPQKVDLGTIVAKDEDDDALTRYKNQLLGNANAKSLTNLVIDANDTRLVLPESITLVFENHKPDIVFDLKGSLAKVREAHAKRTVTIKEGEAYRTKLDFYVQRDIVTGLKLSNKVLKARTITVDKSTFMIGSKAPNAERQTFTSDVEQAPSGLLSRGSFLVKSKLTDDDKNIFAEWEWNLVIAKDWQ